MFSRTAPRNFSWKIGEIPPEASPQKKKEKAFEGKN